VRTTSSKAEYVQRFTKGQRVLVVGRLEIGEWTTRENEVRTSYDIWADDIWADDVVNLSRREDGGVPRASGATRTHRRSRLPGCLGPQRGYWGRRFTVLTACCICLRAAP
jgi:single-stranded DNA-binding protein